METTAAAAAAAAPKAVTAASGGKPAETNRMRLVGIMFNEMVGMTEMVEVVGIFRKSEMVGMVGIV